MLRSYVKAKVLPLSEQQLKKAESTTSLHSCEAYSTPTAPIVHMCRSLIGMAHHATTAVTPSARRIGTTAIDANMTIVRIVRAIATSARKRSVWAVEGNVPVARNSYASTAPVNAKSAKGCFVNRAWKMAYVRTVEKNWRMKMNKRKNESMNMKQQVKRKHQRSSWRAETSDEESVSLRFSPTAWAKLLYFRDKSENEIGGFGISDPEDLLFVREFVTVKQEVDLVSVKFDDSAVADFFDNQVDLGRKPEQFARIWLHSHPGSSPAPSVIDEDTFDRVFGRCQWAVLFVVAQDNRTYAKLRFNVGPGGHVLIPTEIDYSEDFGPSDHEQWDTEYATNVKALEWLPDQHKSELNSDNHYMSDFALPYDFVDEFERMEPEERQIILDELAERPELWDEKEVMIL